MREGSPATMRMAYSALWYVCMPLVLLLVLWRGRKQRAYWSRWGERFGFGEAVGGEQGCLWVHAVSFGEVQAALPLIRALMKAHPQRRMAVTTVTPTGSEQIRKALGDSVFHCYLPYDTPGATQRFLRRLRPAIGVIMETELWPNLYHYCGKAGIPMLLASARLSERSVQGYRKLPGPSLARHMMEQLTAVGAQTTADAERLIQLGALRERVQVTGNVKFDLDLPENIAEQGQALRQMLGAERPVWIAASTHEGEEDQVLEAFRLLRQSLPDAVLLLVPRHPQRFQAVEQYCQREGFSVITRSSGAACSPATDIFLGDSMGEMMLFCAAADIAFVGGSLVPIGGHNLLEPAALGVPSLTGPQTHNFVEITDLMLEVGATIRVADAEALGAAVTRLFAQPLERQQMGEAGLRVIEENRGALQRLLSLVDGILAKPQSLR